MEKEGSKERNIEMLNGHQSIGAMIVGVPRSQISEMKLYNHVTSYRAYVVEPESLLPCKEKEPSHWISFKTGARLL